MGMLQNKKYLDGMVFTEKTWGGGHDDGLLKKTRNTTCTLNTVIHRTHPSLLVILTVVPYIIPSR